MADGAVGAEWTRTSSIMALIANCHRDPEEHPEYYKANDFNPTKEPEPESPPPKVGIGVLKSVFMRKGQRRNG